MSAVGLPPLREVIRAHGLTASKKLGQNFLFDEQLLDRIAAIPEPLAGEAVFEVGPGPGGLTRALLRAGAHVTAVERDERCLPALAELESAFSGKLRIVPGDAMALDPTKLIDGPFHIVSNLPYNVGTALLTRWMGGSQWPPRWKSLTLMFQREVAERIVAKFGTSAYGRLAVLCQIRADAKIAMPVHRSAFTPPPKVMSAVVHIVPKPAPEGVDIALVERLTAAAFGQRRKMLRQSLKAMPGALDAVRDIGLDETARAENLSVENYAAIARRIRENVG